MPNVKNIIIFVGIGLLLVFAYIFLIPKSEEETNLVSDTASSATETPAGDTPETLIGQEFLGLLLNVKNIKLDDSIFSSSAFMSLRDSSILLIPDGNEGRPNPFAPIGVDVLLTTSVPPGTLAPSPNTTPPPAPLPTGGATEDNGL